MSQTQDQGKDSVGKTTPKIDFPAMKCSLHRREVILVCTKQECKYKIFLCPKCISDELNHINEHNPLMDYGDFVRMISETSGVSSQPSEEGLNLVSSKSKTDLLNQFMHHINSQKSNVSSLAEQLSDLYSNKCKELVTSLQDVLENEKSAFENNLTKLEQEVRADKEKDADILKFTELRSRVSNMEDLQEIENFMKSVLRRKQAWQNASEEVNQLSQRTENFYKELITSQQNDKPEFVKSEQIVTEWTTGLSQLIENIKSTSGCFKGLNQRKTISLTIQSSQELYLLTNKMIKDDTEVNLSFSRDNFSVEDAADAAEALQKLQSIKQLKLDFKDSNIQIEAVRILLQAVEKLQLLQGLTINFQGTNYKNDAAKEVGEVLPILKDSLQHLTLDFSFSQLSDDGAKLLAIATQTLVGLNSLHVNFRCNKLKEEGARVWGEALEKLKQLSTLNVDFSGFSKKRNVLNDAGAVHLTKSFRSLKRLQNLTLDLGFCGLVDSSVFELALSLRDLPVLSHIDINLSNNTVVEKGVRKLSKTLTRTRAQNVTVNFNNNGLNSDGVREVVNAFRVKSSINHLVIFARNNSVTKQQGEEFLQNLNFDNQFSKLDLFV